MSDENGNDLPAESGDQITRETMMVIIERGKELLAEMNEPNDEEQEQTASMLAHAALTRG